MGAFAFVFAVTLGGCSFALDFQEECSSDNDCANRGASFFCDAGFCEQRQVISASGPCTKIYGADPRQALPNTVFTIGIALPKSGLLADAGQRMDEAVALAVSEMNQLSGVLGVALAAVSCDTKTTNEGALEAVDHLVNVVGVDAIIGAGASSFTINAFTNIAAPAGVLMISPSATSPALTGIPDQSLLWRTVASDAIQGLAIARLIDQVQLGKVAVIHQSDAYGTGLSIEVNNLLCSETTAFTCDNENFKLYNYPVDDPIVRDQAFATIVTQLVSSPPDVIVLIGFPADGSAFINQASAAGVAPQYILTDGLRAPALLGQEEGVEPISDVNILECVVGTNPASPSGELFETFEDRWLGQFAQPPHPFSANAYDATYLLAFALAAARGAGVDSLDSLRGQDLAAGLARMSSGDRVEVGFQNFTNAVRILSESPTSTIDVVGISGPLDFDSTTGEAPSGIELWRFAPSAGEIVNLGVVLDDQNVYKGGELVPSQPAAECLGRREWP